MGKKLKREPADHKVVCFREYGLPVPLDAKWLTWDERGNCSYWQCDEKPKPSFPIGAWHVRFSNIRWKGDPILHVTPPKPGPWFKQCYWIGD